MALDYIGSGVLGMMNIGEWRGCKMYDTWNYIYEGDAMKSEKSEKELEGTSEISKVMWKALVAKMN